MDSIPAALEAARPQDPEATGLYNFVMVNTCSRGISTVSHYLLAILGHSGKRAATDNDRIRFCSQGH